ncbi:MAG: hypothetical protein RMJ07_06910 [Nitrososphaerota archaeon]|nr:hypothetical protein [Candidatus Bathyarchaeota archaeon]MDW8049384.1 hypothetical protein [Nitrososphaerota archaeon]
MKRQETSISLVTKLFLFSILHGLIYVNYIDLVVPGSNIPGYHLWLVVTYFIAFIPLLFLLGLEEWKLILCLGLTASLMNDLFYYPVGILLFQRPCNLYDWYLFQLGFKGLTYSWTFNAGIFKIPVTSLLMGSSIYLRAAAILLLIYKRQNQRPARIHAGVSIT